MDIVQVLFLAIIGALIGWLTNWIAIKLIFKPRYPYRIPVLNITIQGLLPMRKAELARSIGHTVERELLPPETLLRRVEEMKLKEKIETAFSGIVQERLAEKLKVIPASLRQGIINYLHDLSTAELDRHLDRFIIQLQENFVNESNLGKIVEEQINQFEVDRLEELVFRIVAKELKHIEILGGVLGFIIGLIQAFAIMLM